MKRYLVPSVQCSLLYTDRKVNEGMCEK